MNITLIKMYYLHTEKCDRGVKISAQCQIYSKHICIYILYDTNKTQNSFYRSQPRYHGYFGLFELSAYPKKVRSELFLLSRLYCSFNQRQT